MNMPTPITPPKRSIRHVLTVENPEHTSEILTRLSALPDAAAEAQAFAAKAFDRANGDPATIKARRTADAKRLKRLIKQLARAERHLRGTPRSIGFPTDRITKRMSLTRRMVIGVGMGFVVIEPGITVYTAANILASSGLIESVAGSALAASPMVVILVSGIYGLEALGDSKATLRGRILFERALLWTGALGLLAYGAAFALCFNVSTLADASAALTSLVSAMPAAETLGWRQATVLLAAQLLASVALGAGIALYTTRAADENKVRHVTPCEEFDHAEQAVAAAKADCDDLEATIAADDAFLAEHANARAAFIDQTVNRVVAIRDYVHAKSRAARHEILAELAKTGGPA